MKELLTRMFARPATAVELITASFFIGVLALASPLFVMQVLNRYVSQGVDATLITLTVGVLMAVALEFSFRQARLSLAQKVSIETDREKAAKAYAIATRAKIAAIERIAPDMRRETLNGLAAIEQAYSATNVTAVLDVPFALVFVAMLYLLEPGLAMIAIFFLVTVFVGGLLGAQSMNEKTNELTNASGQSSALMGTAIREMELVRAFNAGAYLRSAWDSHTGLIQAMRRQLNLRQGLIQSITQSANAVMSVAIIVAAGILVVRGDLTVGAMIGANILASRALQPISRFSQLGGTFAKARKAQAMLEEFTHLPVERERGSALSTYSGGIEFRDVAFAYAGQKTPLFESLTFRLAPGSVLVVTGSNGAGKTTFARLILGLLEPSRGQILVDGLDLQQVATEWWRREVAYLPQEPSFLNATIEENLRVNNPDADLSRLNQVIEIAGLRRFLDESANGFETQVVDNGWRLSEGHRRRLALARALVSVGKLVVFDEPTESFDADGIASVHAVLGAFAKQGHTIIVMSHDANIVRGKHVVLDLDVKPAPTLQTVPGVVAAEPQPAVTGARQAGGG